jgi:hypothetical protein
MEPDLFESTATRVTRVIVVIGAAGSIAAFAWGGRTIGMSFLLGAIVGYANFRWLKGFVGGLGPGGKPSLLTLVFLLRYFILAAIAYVILKFSKLSLPAALAGLFTPLAAVIVEVLIQLLYARRELPR